MRGTGDPDFRIVVSFGLGTSTNWISAIGWFGSDGFLPEGAIGK